MQPDHVAAQRRGLGEERRIGGQWNAQAGRGEVGRETFDVSRVCVQRDDVGGQVFPGNCLALVMMTATLAREMGLGVRCQAVVGDDAWDRSGDLYVAVGHVNLTLGDRVPQAGFGSLENDPMTIDFVPPRSAGARRTCVICEQTVIAICLNNRAVESLAAGKANDSYGWAREAIRTRSGTAQRLHHAGCRLPQPALSGAR